MEIILLITAITTALLLIWLISNQKSQVGTIVEQNQLKITESFRELKETQLKDAIETQQSHHRFFESMAQGLKTDLLSTLNHQNESLNTQFRTLSLSVSERLLAVSQEVDKRLHVGFEKTSATFQDVVKRLTQIDEAQKKISELSTHVVSLQDILNDKRSRGAFGEIQLEQLVRNMIPSQHVTFQATLSTGVRVDCLLKLPEPSLSIAIDAKFPLESYRLWQNASSEADSKLTLKTFKQDVKKHIDDIHKKYIILGETSEHALMFVPSETIFAEIHSQFSELVPYAYEKGILLVSPATLMAVLTTAASAIKDAATRQQMHIIQEHLKLLAKDFERFDKRMKNLSKHIEQAHTDVVDINTSAHKITKRFQKIEAVEFDEADEDEHALQELNEKAS